MTMDALPFLSGAVKQFEYYKSLGEKAMAQVPDEQLFWQYNAESNSIAIIVQHLSGNMLSRWTDFLTTDGEKEWRNRDAEFEAGLQTREALLAAWNKGWACLFNALGALGAEDMDKTVYIRNTGQTVSEAINRQLMHYGYHVGQIVYIGRMIAGDGWTSLSIPKGDSVEYNKEKFNQPGRDEHFTGEYLKK